ncbi:MAG: hypothetical protein B7Y90_00295 [Alphaproteobacteria bacterium 32-64-14]|nr:MAG: hypothetical protein B7Y90_00295 [Alphaproteobacteria bacterium 32-64-14]
MVARDPLDVVLARAINPESLYWYSLDLQGADPSVEQWVEARLNLSSAAAQAFPGATGWAVHQVDTDGAIYLRRRQQLTDDAVRGLISEMITLAHRYDGQFWSWIHGDQLER